MQKSDVVLQITQYKTLIQNRLKCKHQNSKILEENLGVNYDVGLGNVFLDMTLKSQVAKKER